MSLFRKSEPEPVAKGGGLEVLRGRAKAHARMPQGYAWLKDALHYNDLDGFLNGRPLPAPTIALLIDYLGMKATYDPETDRLVSTAPEATLAYSAIPASYVGGSNVPGWNEKMIASLKAQLKQLTQAGRA